LARKKGDLFFLNKFTIKIKSFQLLLLNDLERDQLLGEKIYIEKYLKDLVEQYKNDVENILFTQKKTEIDAYKKEIDEKKSIIE